MKTSDLIKKLMDSYFCHGDLPTNITNISWYCPCENGSFERVNLNPTDDSETERTEENNE